MIVDAAAGLASVAPAINTWAGVAALALVLASGHAATFVQGRRTRKLAEKAATAATETREQTVNDHADHPTPNMRAQLDAQDERLKSIEEGVGRLAEAFEQHLEHATQEAARRDEWQLAVERDLTHLNRPLFAWRR